MITQRLDALRRLMRERGMDAYMIPSEDFHQSEYVGEYFKARKYMSGFTGSAGTLVVTMTEAGLWTDGRYFIQAAAQLKDTGITLFKSGQEGVPKVEEYLLEKLPEGGCLGFDGRVVSGTLGGELSEKLSEKKVTISCMEDLVDAIWTDRPALTREPAWLLDEKYAGKSMEEKLSDLRKTMEKEGATVHILTSLDDIAWLFNIRGNDTRHNPVVLSYTVITMDKAYLFMQEGVAGDEIKERLIKADVTLRPYNDIYTFVTTIDKGEKVLLDPGKVNFAILNGLKKEITIVKKPNPTILAKAVKNPVEAENIRLAHIKDGVAVTRFIYWLKHNIGKIKITEISASDYLEALRRECPTLTDLSFSTIVGYKENGAMCHYSATPESDRTLEQESLLVVDSGGQYLEGTTDITRTIALGALSHEEKYHFTLVLRGMIGLSKARFLYGCRGFNLDYLARGPLWEAGLDFNHGTGHGVGYLLNVHEAPNGFRWKVVPERSDSCIFEEGMLTSNEPGFYLEGKYGIRTENLMLCRKAEKNEYGQFMEFETVTLCPIDRDAILPELMTKAELDWLNSYHKRVYDTLSPYLSTEEAAWLKEVTGPLCKEK